MKGSNSQQCVLTHDKPRTSFPHCLVLSLVGVVLCQLEYLRTVLSFHFQPAFEFTRFGSVFSNPIHGVSHESNARDNWASSCALCMVVKCAPKDWHCKKASKKSTRVLLSWRHLLPASFHPFPHLSVARLVRILLEKAAARIFDNSAGFLQT